jgi:hypothetical protein
MLFPSYETPNITYIYKTTGKIVIVLFLIFMLLNRRMEDSDVKHHHGHWLQLSYQCAKNLHDVFCSGNGNKFREYCILVYNAMKSRRSLLVFYRTVLPPFSGPKNRVLLAGSFLLITDPEDRGNMFF